MIEHPKHIIHVLSCGLHTYLAIGLYLHTYLPVCYTVQLSLLGLYVYVYPCAVCSSVRSMILATHYMQQPYYKHYLSLVHYTQIICLYLNVSPFVLCYSPRFVRT